MHAGKHHAHQEGMLVSTLHAGQHQAHQENMLFSTVHAGQPHAHQEGMLVSTMHAGQHQAHQGQKLDTHTSKGILSTNSRHLLVLVHPSPSGFPLRKLPAHMQAHQNAPIHLP
eukprot:1159541-Pelagomonas_calceolata.AAC.4